MSTRFATISRDAQHYRLRLGQADSGLPPLTRQWSRPARRACSRTVSPLLPAGTGPALRIARVDWGGRFAAFVRGVPGRTVSKGEQSVRHYE